MAHPPHAQASPSTFSLLCVAWCSPPNEGEHPTCTPRCIVCGGQHNTGSTNFKYRYIKEKHPSAAPATTTKEPSRTSRRSPARGNQRSRSPSLRVHSTSFPPLDQTDQQRQPSRSRSRGRQPSRSRSHSTHWAPSAHHLRSSSRGLSSSESSKTVAWHNAPHTSLTKDPRVRELAKENSDLKCQAAKLTSYIQTLESEPDRAL